MEYHRAYQVKLRGLYGKGLLTGNMHESQLTGNKQQSFSVSWYITSLTNACWKCRQVLSEMFSLICSFCSSPGPWVLPFFMKKSRILHLGQWTDVAVPLWRKCSLKAEHPSVCWCSFLTRVSCLLLIDKCCNLHELSHNLSDWGVVALVSQQWVFNPSSWLGLQSLRNCLN